MGNPLSPILANLFLEHVESELLPTFSGTSPFFWVRYVDDVLAAVNPNFCLESFLSFINSFYPTLKFTHEWESNSSIPFLDVLISKCSSGLSFKVFRKNTHCNSYLHFFSYHNRNTKIHVAQGLYLRALRICSPSFLNDEIKYISNSLSKLAYPKSILNIALSRAKKSFYSPQNNQPDRYNNKPLVIPFISTLDNSVNHRLSSFEKSKIIFKYPNKIKSNLIKNSSPKNVGVYKIPCKNCDSFYVGETGRDWDRRLKEHKHSVSQLDPSNALAYHVLNSGHCIDFDSASLIYKCGDFSIRRIYEAAFIESNCNRVLNLNKGFYTIDRHIANCILRSNTH